MGMDTERERGDVRRPTGCSQKKKDKQPKKITGTARGDTAPRKQAAGEQIGAIGA